MSALDFASISNGAFEAFQQSVNKLGVITNDIDGSFAGVVSGSKADIGSSGTDVAPGSYSGGQQGTQASNTTPSKANGSGASSSNGQDSTTPVGDRAVDAVLSFFGLKISLLNIIFMVLGVLFIAAGIFSFRSTQTIIQKGASVAAKGAELIP